MNRGNKILTGILAILAIASLWYFNTSPIFGVKAARIGPVNLYPDSKETPGVVATSDFKELTTVSACGTYSQCHRMTSDNLKKRVCEEYPNNCTAPREIDHFVPLCIGGADSLLNLWAQPETNQWNGKEYGFHVKDKLETYLCSQMKAGKITPKDAQQCLLTDWVSCYQKYFGNNFGAGNTDNTDNEDITQ